MMGCCRGDAELAVRMLDDPEPFEVSRLAEVLEPGKGADPVGTETIDVGRAPADLPAGLCGTVPPGSPRIPGRGNRNNWRAPAACRRRGCTEVGRKLCHKDPKGPCRSRRRRSWRWVCETASCPGARARPEFARFARGSGR